MDIGSIVALSPTFNGWKDIEMVTRFKEKHGYVFPEKGVEYMVRDIYKSITGSITILLEEIINPEVTYVIGEDETQYTNEIGFNIKLFVELLPPMEIGIEEWVDRRTLEECYIL